MIGGVGTAPLGMAPLGVPGGGDYSEAAPLAELLANPLVDRTWLLRATVKNRETGDPVVVRLGSRGYWSRAEDGDPREIYPPALITPYNWSIDLLRSGRLVRGVAGSRAEITAANDGSLDGLLRDVLWRRADLETMLGDGRPRSGSPLSSFGRVQRASAEGISSTTEQISIRQRDSSRLLDVPLQARRYAGFGQAVRLDGVDDYLSVGDHLDPAEHSFFALVRGRMASAKAGIFEWLLRKKFSTSGDPGWRLVWNADDALVARIEDAAGAAGHISVLQGELRDDRIHSMAVVLDRTAQTWTLWADGALLGEVDVSGLGSVATPQPFVWGSKLFVGDLVEVAFGYRVPSPPELSAWSARSLDAEADDCAVWHLNEGTGSTAYAAAAQSVIDADPSITQASDLDATITGAVWVGSLEGDATIAGKYKPAWYGTVEEVEPPLVDPLNNIYQIHDPSAGGFVWEISEIRDSGLGTADPGGWANLGDVADLYSVSPAQGELYTSKAAGLVRFGGNGAAGRVTWSGKVSVDPVRYVGDRWSIAQYLAKVRAGLDPATQINAGSFGAAASRAYEAGVGGGLQRRTVADAIAELAYPDCRAYMDRQARLSLFCLAPPEVVAYDVVYRDGDLARGATERLYSAEPVDRVTVRWGHRRTTQRAGELAGALTPGQRAALGEEWRLAWSGSATPTDELVVESAVVSQADAQAIADILFSVYGVLREAYRIPVPAELYQRYLGDGVATEWERYGLDVDHAGAPGARRHLVTGVTEVVSRDRQTVHLVTLS